MFKKLLAGVLSAVTVLSMSMTASASGTEASAVIGIATNDTPYTTYLEATDRASKELKVRGMNADYEWTPMNRTEARNVTWSVVDDLTTVSGLTNNRIKVAVSQPNTEVGYISTATVDLSGVPTDSYGYGVVRAEYGASYINFAFVFNPGNGTAVPSATNVSCVFKQGSTVLASAVVPTVAYNPNASGMAKYPNALSATQGAEGLNNIVDVDIQNGYIVSVTIKGADDVEVTYPETSNDGYWTYEVVGNDVSKVLGADVVPVVSGNQIVWSYTATPSSN